MTQTPASTTGTPATIGYVPPQSYLAHFIYRRPIKIMITEDGPGGQQTQRIIAVPAWTTLQGTKVYKIGLDLGNNGPKAAMFDADGAIIVKHVQAVVKSVQDLATGDLETVYEELLEQPSRLDQHHEETIGLPVGNTTAERKEEELPSTQPYSSPQTEPQSRPRKAGREISLGKEWIDRKAIEQEGVSLAKGTTQARLADPRYPRLLMYTIAGLFEKAGYPEGDYDLLLGIGMPNEEIVNGDLDAETQAALQKKLCGKRWRIRITEQQQIKQFNLKVIDFAPGPQSYAGFYAWQNRPDARPAQTLINEILLEDLGANDLHELWIRLHFSAEQRGKELHQRVKVTATRERKGDGIILSLIQPFARRLKKMYALGELDDAIAQEAFLRREITVGGFSEDVSHLVSEVESGEGAKVVTDVFKGPSRSRCFYIIEGGGNVLLRAALLDKLRSLRRTSRTYLLLGADHASQLNAVGLLAILDQMCRFGQA